ncbi:MAG: CBS domain-containing protein [Betaproteobacteria bacterium]|nr:CBS domain-containing protein [Betaproteobacteria bacterium]
MTRKEHSLLERRLAGEQQTFARPLRSLVLRAAVTCDRDDTIAQTAALMRAHGVGSVVAVDSRSQPVGIVTSHDMVRVVAGNAGAQRVAEIMSPDPVSLPAHALAFEAAVTMTARRIRHVLVMDEGRLIGVVSERDLFSLQRLGLGEITMEMRLASAVPVLAGLAAVVRTLTETLVGQGVATEQVALFVSVLNDRLSQRVIEIVRKRHDLERISWCWLAFGSEGRVEQTFASDQDNGLVFVAHDGSSPRALRDRLLPFAREVNDGLDACGFPLCKGNVMASNPALCLSLDEWKTKFAGWLVNTDPQALLDASICFDFRALAGDATLTAALREWLLARVRSRPAFLRLLAENAMTAHPASGLLRDFATDDAPEAPHSIDLKMHGARPFVDAARVYALAHGLPQTGTVERLRAAVAARALGGADVSAWVRAFGYIQGLRLRTQGLDRSEHRAAVNRVDPDSLDEFERRSLKEAFRQASRLQQRLRLDYRL